MESTKDPKLQDDERLMKQVAAGDKAAKKQLIVMLWRRVNNMSRHLSPYVDEAEDFTQEALLQILRSAPNYRADGCLEAWADIITVRTVMKMLRDLHRKRQFFGGWSDERISGSDMEQHLLRKARGERVTELLYRLQPDRRVALVLKLVHGYKVSEVAAMMDRPVHTVRYLLRKGRARLRRLVVKDRTLRELFSGKGLWPSE